MTWRDIEPDELLELPVRVGDFRDAFRIIGGAIREVGVHGGGEGEDIGLGLEGGFGEMGLREGE